jgi:hypothetical protein
VPQLCIRNLFCTNIHSFAQEFGQQLTFPAILPLTLVCVPWCLPSAVLKTYERADNIAMSKRTWLVFAAIQAVGCTLAGFGTVYSESALIRGAWLVGFLLLVPGNLPAMALGQTLIHVRTAYVFFPVAIACNLLLWLMCSTLWRAFRPNTPKNQPNSYAIALFTTALVFVIANTIHLLRPATCADCFFPYGLPFTLYHDGGFAGGAGFVWVGLAADIACVVGIALLIGRIWEVIARTRVRSVKPTI